MYERMIIHVIILQIRNESSFRVVGVPSYKKSPDYSWPEETHNALFTIIFFLWIFKSPKEKKFHPKSLLRNLQWLKSL